MKRFLLLIVPFFLLTLVFGCSSHKKHHNTDMPDPQSFNAHFGDMDANGDDLVNWEEFSAHFKNADPKIFNTIDMNQDGNIDHDEWHEFKEAHGMKKHD